MESSSSKRVELSTSFEQVPTDHLVELIGRSHYSFILQFLRFIFCTADMLQRLMNHNDKIPLSP